MSQTRPIGHRVRIMITVTRPPAPNPGQFGWQAPPSLGFLDWHAELTQQRRAGVPQIVKADATNTASSARSAKILLTLAGSIGVPIGVVNTRTDSLPLRTRCHLFGVLALA